MRRFADAMQREGLFKADQPEEFFLSKTVGRYGLGRIIRKSADSGAGVLVTLRHSANSLSKQMNAPMDWLLYDGQMNVQRVVIPTNP
ncbi:MAG: hypothetical protein IAF08_12710 [Rhizobacter sp.]|nr:hypothetical protein [Chlorobiales bacterium]